MKKNFTLILRTSFWVFILFCTMQNLNAQVGIGTTSPAASSALDITSTTKGLLTPRMTTVQKNAIVAPANGLMVYDTDLKVFSYYDLPTTTWINVTQGRSKFKRIKSTDVLAAVLAAELSAGSGTKYLLDSQTLYEINGTINVDLPIELNNAYVIGLDSSDDKLIKATGNLFTGTTGGSIRVLTLSATAGSVFNINGGGTQNLIFRDMIITGSANVGLIQNFNMVFSSIVQYVGNANGTIYRNISKLLLDNQGWFGNNTGVFEKYEGTFGSIQKQGGFSDVNGAAIGMDFSSNPIITNDGTMQSVSFAGTLSTGKYVNPYTGVGTYPGYNFNNKWSVSCPGIPVEGDRFSSSNLYLDRQVTSPTINFPSTNLAYKLSGSTIATNLYRMSDGATNNRLVYEGRVKRTFTISSSISMQVGGNGVTDFLFFFVKWSSAGVPTIVTSSETFIDSNSGFVQSFSVTGTVELSNGDYVELYGSRVNGNNKTLTFNSYNMSLR